MLSVISSPLYNTFNYKPSDFKDKESLLNKFIELKNEGINFNLPVVTNKGILSFADYIITNTSIGFYYDLLKSDVVKNSFVFKIEGDFVIEHEVYNLNWMKSNFKQYKDVILNSVKRIAIELENNPVSKIRQVSYLREIQIIDNVPPLFHIINNVVPFSYRDDDRNKADVWDTAITYNSQLKDYLKDKFSNHKETVKTLGASDSLHHIGHSGLAGVLFHHNLIRKIIEKNPHSAFYLIYDAIEKNEIQDVKKLIPIYHRSEKFTAENNHQILCSSRTPEMARLLMENGFSFFNYTQENDHEPKRILFSIERDMNADTIDAIIGFKNSHKNLIHKHSQIIFDDFFKKNNEPLNFNKEKKFENIKLLVEKYDFPIEQFDMLKVGFDLDNKNTQYSKWFLEHGANPDNCADFVFAITQHKNFEKILAQYEQIINMRTPDFVYEMSKYWSGNNFTEDELLQKTTKGYYAWWGLNINSSAFTKFMHNRSNETIEKIKNTFSSNDSSWLGKIVSEEKIDSHISWLEQYKKTFFKPDEKMPLIIKNDNNENALHFLLKESTRSPVIKFILEETDADIAKLLQEKNKSMKTPLQQLLFEDEFQKERALWLRQGKTVAQITKKLVNHLKEDFPFDCFVSESENAIDVIKQWYPDDNFYQEHYGLFNKNKISKIIPEKMTFENKKIKI